MRNGCRGRGICYTGRCNATSPGVGDVAKRKQRIRTELLIAFTLAVIAFGATRLWRTYRQEQQRESYVRIEQDLRDYLQRPLSEEQDQLEDFARAAHGRVRCDAAALLAQTRRLVQKTRRRGLRAGTAAARKYEDVRRNFERVKQGKPAVFPIGEPFLRAFYSPADLSLNTYSVCAPAGPSERPPLILTLRPSPGADAGEHLDAPCYEGALSASPQELPADSPIHLREAQVIGTLNDLAQAQSFDPDGVYLFGRGGAGLLAWHVAVHYPDRFAGVAVLGPCPACVGRPSEGPWPGAAGDVRQAVRFVISSLCPASYAENLARLSPVVIHPLGGGVELAADSCIVGRLRELGHAVEFLEVPVRPGEGLPEWTAQYALAKALAAESAGRAEEFRFKTASLRHNRAWWVRLEQLGDPVRFSTVQAAVEGDRAVVKTENVSALTILPDRMPEGVSAVSMNGAEHPLPPGADPLTLHREADWGANRPPGPQKAPGLSGPFEDVLRDAFAVVYGTEGEDEALKKVCRNEARRFADGWEYRHGRRPRLVSDEQFDPREMERVNLLLFGGPEVNGISRRIGDRLSVRLEGGGVKIAGREYRGDGVGVLFCHLNPLAPDRMIAMVAGPTPGALYQAYDRFGLDLDRARPEGHKWFDYAVFDARTAGPESYLEVGFFDNGWAPPQAGQAPEDGGVFWTREAAVAADLRPQRFPALASAADAGEDEVFLSRVRPAFRGPETDAVGFDRSVAGGTIRLGGQSFSNGLGVRVPASLSFRLDGEFRTFRVSVGLTEAGRLPGSGDARGVVFEVRGDGELLERSEALPINGGPGVEDLTVDVTGVRSLTLYVRPVPDDAEVGAGAAWAQAIVLR